MPQFAPHGSSIFEFKDQIVILRSRGPFNVEHVHAVVAAYRKAAESLRQNGPWATINIIHESMLLTAEGVTAMGESARLSRELGRCAAAYVVDESVEGYNLIMPALRKVCADLLPIEAFPDLPQAQAWCQQQIELARQDQLLPPS